jgi:thiamine biosynthesis protein ThiS
MRITVNDEPRTLAAGSTLSDLLTQFSLVPERVAIEVNEKLVRRGSYAQTPLQEGDRVEIVTLVGGG